MNDKIFLQRCLELARRGYGHVSPNPMVGAVIVNNGRIVSEGFHEKFGGPHAEVVAINNAGSNLSGATLYVNLEPCCHTGKTPPCTEAIIKSGIKKVVYISSDPNPKIDGKSSDILLNAGIDCVQSELLQKESFELNHKFFHWMKSGTPFIAGKMALTLDGKIADKHGDSKWITSSDSRDYVHELRKGFDAILVGSNTVTVDNPNLGLHSKSGRDPLRIILTNKSLDSKLDVFRNENFVILNDLSDLFSLCAERNISSVLIEGGAKTFTSALKMNLLNRLYLFYGLKMLGSEHLSGINDLGFNSLNDSVNFELIDLVKFEAAVMINLNILK